MLTLSNIMYQHGLRRWSWYCISITLLIAFFIILGWITGSSFFLLSIAGNSTMNPLSAICFILIATTFCILNNSRLSQRQAQPARGIVFIPILVGVLRLSDFIVNDQFGIDSYFLPHSLTANSEAALSFRMPPNTALNLIVFGLSLLFFKSGNRKRRDLSGYLAIAGGFLALFFLIGYIYEVDQFNSVVRYLPMSLPTGICFILLTLSILFAEPEGALMRTVMSRYAGGIIARIIIPLTIITPVLFGFLRLHYAKKYYITTEFGVTLLITSIIIFFFLITWYVSRTLNLSDKLKTDAEGEIRILKDKLEKQVEERTAQLSDYKYALEVSSIVTISDHLGKIQYVNENFRSITKYADDEITGRDHRILNSGYHPPLFMQLLWQSVSAGKPWRGEIKNKAKDGSYFWTDTTIIPFLNDKKEPYQYITIMWDITESKESAFKILELNEELIKKDNKLQGLITNNIEIIGLLDENMKAIYRSPNYFNITGYETDELEKSEINSLLHPDDTAIVRDAFAKALKMPGITFPVSLRIKHKLGHYMIMEGNCNNQLNNEALNGIVFNLHDVTEKRVALEKVMQNEKIYRAVAANIPGTAIMIFDEHYNYSVVEGEILNVFGYSKTALTGKNISEVLEPEMRSAVTAHLDKVFAGESIEVKMQVGDYDLVTNYVPLKDDDQKVFSAMVVVSDVSGLTKAERQISQMNVILEKKVKDRTLQLEGINRELEAFTYSVSHDLRAPLRIIDGFANMVTEDYGDKLDEEANRMLKVIKSNAQKMGQLIDDLLKLSRVGKQEIIPVLVDMETIVQTVVEEIKELYSGNYTLHCHNILPAYCDPVFMKQVWSNLIGNAFKYSSQKTSPEIIITSEIKNREILYCIRDNGAGFDEQYADKLFGVFQRLHKSTEFEGTGVGLAIVQRIINKHGGRVWAEGSPGKGAAFYFTLPGT